MIAKEKSSSILTQYIDGLDLKNGLKRFGGDEESFQEVLQSYAVNTQPLLDAIKDGSPDKLADYAITIHGIKGSSHSICAFLTGDKAEDLEKAAKDKDFKFVSENNQAFIEITEKLLRDLNDMLVKITRDELKTKKDKPAKDVLNKILAACESYNIDEINKAMSELECYEYETGNELVKWIRKNVESMNLDEIAERLLRMKNL
jgi:hypothetical protein